MGIVLIRDLALRGIIGIHPWERETPQNILINLELQTDLRRAGQTDDIADCLDYQKVADNVAAHVASTQKFTVEALAADLAQICLADSRVEAVKVRVEKPDALPSCRSVGVEIAQIRTSPD